MRENRLVAEQLRRNRQTRDGWRRFAEHRARVADLLCGERGRSICLLGAGNCNDLDLARLSACFEEVHLVDLDGAAMRAGVERQGAAQGVVFHEGIELTGLFEALTGPTPVPDALQRLADAAPVDLPRGFQAVASVGLLSQLIESVALACGAVDPAAAQLLLAVRRQHLQLMLDLLAPGGRGTLVTDVVSSHTCPELAALGDDQLAAALPRWIQAGNFFTGANPWAIALQLQQLGAVDVRMASPWKWDLGPRVYAVAAVQFNEEEEKGRRGEGERDAPAA